MCDQIKSNGLSPGNGAAPQGCRVRPLVIYGTRPEAIKMAPVVHESRRESSGLEPILCSTGQHREMLAQVTDYFGIEADVDLELMQPNQTLAGLTGCCIQRMDDVLKRYEPDCVVVQGDTTTAMVASMAAFYHRVPVVHIEAGLRTGDLAAPWPEEFNRRVVSIATTLHCAPTRRAATALLAEGVKPEAIRVTGNTVVDALLMSLVRERANAAHWTEKYAMLVDRPVVLITGHRRESFGTGMENICRAIAMLAQRFPERQFVYPVHLNPAVQEPVYRILGGKANIHLIAPTPYPEFVWLMDRCELILTDSGGVQEEAPSLHKPVLVMRQTTERPEAVESGVAQLVGTTTETIVREATAVLESARSGIPSGRSVENPYGDGRAAARIVAWIREAIPRRGILGSDGDRK